MSQGSESNTKLTFLSRPQRRVLGVLLEKAFTTPDVYPLTIKATTAGCNQKSNRDPVVEYDEDRVETVLDELREMGLAAIVHTESGRSARFRHYMRHVTTLSEPQLAIMTELMLRGRQSIGDLRVRASRMVAVETLEQLRAELQGLIEMGLVQSDAPLDRRGVEIDHTLYPPNENHPKMTPRAESAETDRQTEDRVVDSRPSGGGAAVAPLVEQLQKLEQENADLGARVESLEQRLAKLESELGG